MTIFEMIEKDLAEIKELPEPDYPQKDNQVVIGTASDREKKLHALSFVYEKQSRHLQATELMVDNDESASTELNNEAMRYKGLSQLVSDIMWAEMRLRLKDEIKKTKNDGMGLRKGYIIVLRPERNNNDPMMKLFKGLFER